MIRPGAADTLRRWREPMVALGLIALGTYWGLTSLGILGWIGWAMVIAGLGLGAVAVQRLRFGQGSGGPGIVTVDERRVVYWGPHGGGVADLDLLTRLELIPAPGAAAWRLTAETGQRVDIPVNAEGADGLFDVFAALPGIHTAEMLNALRHPPATPLTIWESGTTRLH